MCLLRPAPPLEHPCLRVIDHVGNGRARQVAAPLVLNLLDLARAVGVDVHDGRSGLFLFGALDDVMRLQVQRDGVAGRLDAV